MCHKFRVRIFKTRFCFFRDEFYVKILVVDFRRYSHPRRVSPSYNVLMSCLIRNIGIVDLLEQNCQDCHQCSISANAYKLECLPRSKKCRSTSQFYHGLCIGQASRTEPLIRLILTGLNARLHSHQNMHLCPNVAEHFITKSLTTLMDAIALL